MTRPPGPSQLPCPQAARPDRMSQSSCDSSRRVQPATPVPCTASAPHPQLQEQGQGRRCCGEGVAGAWGCRGRAGHGGRWPGPCRVPEEAGPPPGHHLGSWTVTPAPPQSPLLPVRAAGPSSQDPEENAAPSRCPCLSLPSPAPTPGGTLSPQEGKLKHTPHTCQRPTCK